MTMQLNLTDKKEDILYIMGNGFDLAHNINSKYRHFSSWLYQNGHERFVEAIEKMFPMVNEGQQELWKDFEGVLGNYNSDNIQLCMDVTPNNIYSKKDLDNSMATIKQTIRHIRPLMKEWAQNIDITKVMPQYDLNKESKYLTFNYTMTLEKIYAIPHNNICHIHGCVDNDESLIVGHTMSRSPYIYRGRDEKEIPQREIIKTMNKLDKCVKEQIEKNSSFFNSLCHIDTVIVIGHSLAMTDEQYFHEVKSRIQSDASWHFTYHSHKDQLAISSFVQRFHLKKKNYTTCEL